MSAIVIISHVNRWLLRELIDSLLRPLFIAYKNAERAGQDERAFTLRCRFWALLDRLDCFPFVVEVDVGLWILDEPSEDPFGEGEL